jgi:hypothetical protein
VRNRNHTVASEQLEACVRVAPAHRLPEHNLEGDAYHDIRGELVVEAEDVLDQAHVRRAVHTVSRRVLQVVA